MSAVFIVCSAPVLKSKMLRLVRLLSVANSVKQTVSLFPKQRSIHTSFISFNEEIFPPSREPEIPAYEEKFDEPLKIKRARLLYQSRKRGVSENGILLSTFADKHLKTMNEKQLNEYDRLINLPSNDWDIYYWMTGSKETPIEFDNDMMKMLKEHVQNKDREARTRQPDRLLNFNN